MRALRERIRRDDGWTLVEAVISIVIMAIMVLGLTIVLLAFREQLDRSWAVRTMDQYGNDVVEQLTYDLRNATDLTVRNGAGNTSRIYIKYLDPVRHDRFLDARWDADLRNVRIRRENVLVDPTFPPQDMGRGESYEIIEFTAKPYGTDSPNDWERADSFRRKPTFMNAAWDIRFKIRYTRRAIELGERNWSVEREYFNRVYIRNMNLIVKQGIVD